jgi:hypothetical protein
MDEEKTEDPVIDELTLNETLKASNAFSTKRHSRWTLRRAFSGTSKRASGKRDWHVSEVGERNHYLCALEAPPDEPNSGERGSSCGVAAPPGVKCSSRHTLCI